MSNNYTIERWGLNEDQRIDAIMRQGGACFYCKMIPQPSDVVLMKCCKLLVCVSHADQVIDHRPFSGGVKHPDLFFSKDYPAMLLLCLGCTK